MPKNARPTTVHPLSLRELEVSRVHDLTPGMRRVTLTGAQLDSFTSPNGLDQPAFRSSGFDDAVRLHLPYPGESEPVLPVQKPGRLEYGKDPRPLSKVYTVRGWDAERREIDLDFVKHGTGAATTWAYRAEVGSRIHLSGPPASEGLPAADWLLVAGDETALPAIGRLLDQLPTGIPAQLFIEIADPAHQLELSVPKNVELTWLHRDGAAPGATTHLLDAVRAAPWWAGRPWAWIAGETTIVRDIRRHLVEDRAVPKADIEFTGYWKRTEVVALADDPAVPDPEKNPEAFEKLHELGELLPPLAIRAAVNLDIPDKIARGATTADEIAVQIDADPVALGKLLRYLHAIEILEESSPGHYQLSDAGDFLLADFVIDVLHRDGPVARQELAFHGLEEAVRTGRASYASVTGQDFSALRAEQWFDDTYLDSIAAFAPYVAAPLVESGALDGAAHVVLHSDGSASIAQALLTRSPEARVTIAALPSHAAWLRRELSTSISDGTLRARVAVAEQSIFEAPPTTDAVVLAKSLSPLPDADAVHVLRQSATSLAPGGRVIVLEDVFDVEELDEHAAEADLLNLALHGSGHRTDSELRSLFERAGLQLSEVRTVGWGHSLYLLHTP